MDDQKLDLIGHAARIVAGYASNHTVDDLPALIRQVHGTLNRLAGGRGEEEAAPSHPRMGQPAVPVAKSVMPDYIICLEDGKKMKMLKRYLKATYDMSPEEYRAKWDLPDDYPMVAPNYAAKRSQLAKKSGLGKDRK
jgi:predicted transcriptional regulator